MSVFQQPARGIRTFPLAEDAGIKPLLDSGVLGIVSSPLQGKAALNNAMSDAVHIAANHVELDVWRCVFRLSG